MSKPPYSMQKALKTVKTSQLIEGYKPTNDKNIKEQAKKLASK